MPLVTTHLTPAQFDEWRAHQTREYARDKVANGSWSEPEALTRAETDTHTQLPQGNETPGHHIRRIEDQTTGELIGHIWVGRATEGAPGLAWLYDIEIVPTHRGQGHGRVAMTFAETEAKLLNCTRLGLHVFAQNSAARRLYESAGYKITDYCYTKSI